MSVRAEDCTAIDGCRSCGSARLETFLDLGAMPLSDGLRLADAMDEVDPRFPLEVAFCADCTLAQIRHTVAPEVLFADDYPYYSSFSDALIAHAKANVDARIDELGLGEDDLAVELASNDGYLLQHYVARGVGVLGIDPAKGPVEAAQSRGITTKHAFFTEDLANELSEAGVRAKVLHGNNVLAHVADTNGFVRGMAALLADDGVAVIEVPYVRDLIEHTEFDTIYHEHLCYFSVTAVEALFRRAGLWLNRVERVSIHGGSLRLFASKSNARESSVADLLREEEQLALTRIDGYRTFAGQVEVVRSGLRTLVDETIASGKRVAAYGAAAKGTIMLEAAGLGRDQIAWVADRNTHKQGRLMPGSHVPIVSPDKILEDMPDSLLILPWNFKDEIMAQQSEYAERGGQFIVPVPTPMVVEPDALAPRRNEAKAG